MDKFLKEKKSDSSRIYRVTKISEFIELTSWFSSDGNVIFRGQRQDLPLIPSVWREEKIEIWSVKEREVFEEFKREAIPYLNYLPINDWQWLAVAQHNRLPTRLLDWSKNPLAALWFAVSKPANKNEPGIVYGYNYDANDAVHLTTDKTKVGSPFSIPKTYLYFPEHVFPYIQAQSGIFTVHKWGAGDKEFIPFEKEKDSDLLLIKIEIPAEAFRTIRYHLFRVGISPATLFPGLYGLVERLKYQNGLSADET